MGQAQTKGVVETEVCPSTGPDPTVFRSPQTALPPTPPHSAPAVQNIPTTDAGGGSSSPQPVRSRSSKPKHLIRKLSTKKQVNNVTTIQPPRPAPEGSLFPSAKAARTLGEELKTFEAMVMTAETRAGMEGVTHSKATKASPFAKAKRQSLETQTTLPTTPIPYSAPAGGATLSSLGSIPFAGASGIGGIGGRQGTHRRSSSSSVKSGLASIKSAGRAEKEWRARVAGLAAANNTHLTTSGDHTINTDGIPKSRKPTEYFGPVPPRRTPRTTTPTPRLDGDRSASPGSDALVTPPHTTVETDLLERGTPAKSIASDRTFETLGHYAHRSPTHANHAILDHREIGHEGRKASVPYSISSFYFDPANTSRVSTRPSSFIPSLWLTTIPSDTSPLCNNVNRGGHAAGGRNGDDGDMFENQDEMRTPTMDVSQRDSLPPFDPSRSSSSMVGGRFQHTPSPHKRKSQDVSYGPEHATADSVEIKSSGKRCSWITDESKTVVGSMGEGTVRASPRMPRSREAMEKAQAPVPKQDNKTIDPTREKNTGMTLDFLPLKSSTPALAPRPTSKAPTFIASHPTHPSAHSRNGSHGRLSRTHCRTPSIPLSPVTTFILTAPIETIPWSTQSDFETGEGEREEHPHPFAVAPAEYQTLIQPPPPSPARPTRTNVPSPPSKSPLRLNMTDWNHDSYHHVASSVPRLPSITRSSMSFDPFRAPPDVPAKLHKPQAPNPHQPGQHTTDPYSINTRLHGLDPTESRGTDRRPSALQPLKPLRNPRAPVIGRGGVGEFERGWEKEKMRRLLQDRDLTPSMETGIRPPKSGLPMAVSVLSGGVDRLRWCVCESC